MATRTETIYTYICDLCGSEHDDQSEITHVYLDKPSVCDLLRHANPATQLALFGEYGFRPDYCEAADPESKGIVEHLVGYAKRDLIVPAEPQVTGLAAANAAAIGWCAEVNNAVHSEICAVPAERLQAERELPSLRLEAGGKPASRSAARSTSCRACGLARRATRCLPG